MLMLIIMITLTNNPIISLLIIMIDNIKLLKRSFLVKLKLKINLYHKNEANVG